MNKKNSIRNIVIGLLMTSISVWGFTINSIYGWLGTPFFGIITIIFIIRYFQKDSDMVVDIDITPNSKDKGQLHPNLPLPTDILKKIEQQFQNDTDRQEVKRIIEGLWTETLNVGAPQLARSILTLADGQLNEIKKIVKDYFGDPRDVIMRAEKKLGNPGHYFISTFDEIEKKK